MSSSNNKRRPPLSVVDLVPISDGMTVAETIQSSLRLAQDAEESGYKRYWMAEHHGSRTFMSSATPVLLARVAEHTKTIRLGSGGVMLPNHAPLMIAEYYGTLATIYGDRIDLGIGRAPGTDAVTAACLRRGSAKQEDYSNDVATLIRYLSDHDDPNGTEEIMGAEAGAMGFSYKPTRPLGRVRALPGEGTNIPVWILGSTKGGAQVAAERGLPFCFASHITQKAMDETFALYRNNFEEDAGSAQVDVPTLMGSVNVVCAPTEEEAKFLYTTTQQMYNAVRSGYAGILQPPVDDLSKAIGQPEAAAVSDYPGVTAVGTPEQVVEKLSDFAQTFKLDELIVATYVFDPELRRRSYALLGEAWNKS